MNDRQWTDLLRVIDGEILDPLPIGFIIDCPWLPNWSGMTISDYLVSESRWLDANRRVIERFPRATFLPGYWSEFGMCSEPSAFGSRCIFPDDEFPFPEKLRLEGLELGQMPTLAKPNPRTDGLGPLLIKRMQHTQSTIESTGHKIRFATCRGPLNIATYLVGHSELLMALRLDPEGSHRLIGCVTEFLIDWIRYQKEQFDTIEGLLVLDDIIGFVGDVDFREFVLPYFKQLTDALDVPVNMLHNDAMGIVTSGYLTEMGFNMFNFAFDHPISKIRELAGSDVVLLGNLPPRDVLAAGTPDDVRRGVREMVADVDDYRRIMFSCGGGMPPGVSSENIDAFIEAVDDLA